MTNPKSATFTTTSDRAVTDYLDNLLCDVGFSLEPTAEPTIESIPKPQQSPPAQHGQRRYVSYDTTDVTRRMVPVTDPFALMDIRQQGNNHLMWLSVHELLPVIGSLPASHLRDYCLRQCAVLIRQARVQARAQ